MLAKEAARQAQDGAPRELANILWALAKFKLTEARVPEVFDALAQACAAKAPAFNAQDVSNTAWAWATAGATSNQAGWDALAAHAPSRSRASTSARARRRGPRDVGRRRAALEAIAQAAPARMARDEFDAPREHGLGLRHGRLHVQLDRRCVAVVAALRRHRRVRAAAHGRVQAPGAERDGLGRGKVVRVLASSTTSDPELAAPNEAPRRRRAQRRLGLRRASLRPSSSRRRRPRTISQFKRRWRRSRAVAKRTLPNRPSRSATTN